jgi:hypothetical protein
LDAKNGYNYNEAVLQGVIWDPCLNYLIISLHLLIPEKIYAGHYSIPVYFQGIYFSDNGEQL